MDDTDLLSKDTVLISVLVRAVMAASFAMCSCFKTCTVPTPGVVICKAVENAASSFIEASMDSARVLVHLLEMLLVEDHTLAYLLNLGFGISLSSAADQS